MFKLLVSNISSYWVLILTLMRSFFFIGTTKLYRQSAVGDYLLILLTSLNVCKQMTHKGEMEAFKKKILSRTFHWSTLKYFKWGEMLAFIKGYAKWNLVNVDDLALVKTTCPPVHFTITTVWQIWHYWNRYLFKAKID